MRYILILLATAAMWAACNGADTKPNAPANLEQQFLNDPSILPIAKEYYQGKKAEESAPTLDMLDSLFVKDSIKTRFYFAAATKLLAQPLNFRDIVSLYAFKFVHDRPLRFISQFTEDNTLIDYKATWKAWCLTVGYESIMKNPAGPFEAIKELEETMKARFRTVSPNAMEMGAKFINDSRQEIIKLLHDNPQLNPQPETKDSTDAP